MKKTNLKKLKMKLEATAIAASTLVMTMSTSMTAHASLTPTVDENTVKTYLYSGLTSIQAVLTAIVVVVGIVAALKTIISKLPSLDDPHVQNEMWKGIGYCAAGVAAGACLVWVGPYVWGIFYH